MNNGINWLILILVAWAIAAYIPIPRVSRLYYLAKLGKLEASAKQQKVGGWAAGL